MNSHWLEPGEVNPSDELIAYLGGERFIAEIFCRRGISSLEQVKELLEGINFDGFVQGVLPELKPAVDRVINAIANKEQILIWGDFDVDGVTATAVLLDGLRELGANVSFHIPDRVHGIPLPELKKMLPEIGLLLTCDTGVNSPDAVRFCRQHGVDVVITDHHPPLHGALPTPFFAGTILFEESNPLRHLSGVGIAYVFLKLVFHQYTGKPSDETNLDLVALGTLADRVLLLNSANRYLVKGGLGILRQSPRPSIQMLSENLGVQLHGIREDHLLNLFIPRLNAFGRFGKAKPLVEFLLSEDRSLLRGVASDIEGIYAKSRLQIHQVTRSALKELEDKKHLSTSRLIILFNPEWPRSVLGVVASRIMAETNKPAFLITGKSGNLVSGAARAPENINLLEVFEQISLPGLEFYGHPYAVGFKLHPEDLHKFERQTLEVIAGKLHDTETQISVDAELDVPQISKQILNWVENLGPFGPGIPPLQFLHRQAKVIKVSHFGREREHLSIKMQDKQGETFTLQNWYAADTRQAMDLEEGSEIDFIYSVRKNDYRGRDGIQLEWVDFRKSEGKDNTSLTLRQIQVIDWRERVFDNNLLRMAGDNALFWAEGDLNLLKDLPEVNVCSRLDLHFCKTLVIITIPPDFGVLHSAIRTCTPERVIFLGNDPQMDEAASLMRRVLSALKYAANRQKGEVNTEKLATLCAHTTKFMRSILHWLDENRVIRIQEEIEDTMVVKLNEAKIVSLEMPDSLVKSLNETKAFRAFYLRSKTEDLLPEGWEKVIS